MAKRKKKEKLDRKAVLKEKRKLLKVLMLMCKVYKKGAKTREERKAYGLVEEDLKKIRQRELAKLTKPKPESKPKPEPEAEPTTETPTR
jgi:hypothetical protein